MIKPTQHKGVRIMTPTPFEQSHLRAADLGLRIIESLAVNKMITAARVFELQMADVGHGVPPLGETVTIGLMWGDLAQFAIGEA
jgi:hypothetical protein